MQSSLAVRAGRRHPPGATPDGRGVNFSVFSREATSVELLLYEGPSSLAPFQAIALDPEEHRTFFHWHVYVEGLRPGVCYGWRMGGPGDAGGTGHRFDGEKVLLDPWARAVTDGLWDRARASLPGGNEGSALRAMVVDEAFDWEGDEPLRIPPEEMIIYELHVGGFTRHPSAGVEHPGTFAALREKIPYLQALGINCVELLPVMAFDAQDVPDSVAARGLSNYWGYSTHSFYSPHPGYCVSPESGTHRQEFRELVKALHRAGIAVVLDVVFNHTAEGGMQGPIISFKGMDNAIFYHLDPEDLSRYRDYTGCGNTVNCNHPLVGQFIVECLEYWAQEMHVDGFRFDLASVLARGENGEPMYHAPVLWSIELSDRLAGRRIIAEAWDAGGLYQVGGFPGYRWQEWNGRYRDVMRQFVRGDPGLVGEVATRIGGSSDLYAHQGRLPINSVNFITCHDGFTLWDLVSYEAKRNEANGEDNRDGSDDNRSWNCGAEGETQDPQILALRRRQAKNFVAVLLLSRGVPMLLSGDEVLRTQGGNNNTWCQDNELSWFDWELPERNTGMLRFVREMIALRRRHPSLMRRRFFTGRPVDPDGPPDVRWHGSELEHPLWEDPEARVLAYTLAPVSRDEGDLHVIFNFSDEDRAFALPEPSAGRWHLAVDTASAEPRDIRDQERQPLVGDDSIPVGPRSVCVLEAR